MAKTWLSPDGTRELRWEHYRVDSFAERVHLASLRAHPGDRVLVEWEEDLLDLQPGREGRVFFVTRGLNQILTAHAVEDGRVLREFGTAWVAFSLPGDEVVLAHAKGGLTAFEVATGVRRWTFAQEHWRVAPGWRHLVGYTKGRWHAEGVSPSSLEVIDLQAGTSLWKRQQAAGIESVEFSTAQPALVVRSRGVAPEALELTTGRPLSEVETGAAVSAAVPGVDTGWPPTPSRGA